MPANSLALWPFATGHLTIRNRPIAGLAKIWRKYYEKYRLILFGREQDDSIDLAVKHCATLVSPYEYEEKAIVLILE